MQEMIRLKEIEIEEKRGAGEIQMELSKLNKTCLKIQNWVIRSRKSDVERQHNDQKKRDKQRSTKHTYITKDRVIPTTLKTGVNSGAPEEFLNH